MNYSPLDIRNRLTQWAIAYGQTLDQEAQTKLSAALNQWGVPAGDYVISAVVALLPEELSLNNEGKQVLVDAMRCIDSYAWNGLFSIKYGQEVNFLTEATRIENTITSP